MMLDSGVVQIVTLELVKTSLDSTNSTVFLRSTRQFVTFVCSMVSGSLLAPSWTGFREGSQWVLRSPILVTNGTCINLTESDRQTLNRLY